MRGAALGVLLLAGAALLLPSLRVPARPLAGMRLEEEAAFQDLGFLALGMRRQAADLHFIRLLQYYGQGAAAEELGPPRSHEHHEGDGHDHGHERPEPKATYPEMLARTLRILELDPYNRYATLFSAGALAYNLDRPDEAVRLLKAAIETDPKAWRYHLYLAAMGYKKVGGDPREMVRLLEPALTDPDCPAMLKAIVAGIYQRLGQPRKAAEIYLDILEHSRDPEYRRLAEDRLEKLLKK